MSSLTVTAPRTAELPSVPYLPSGELPADSLSDGDTEPRASADEEEEEPRSEWPDDESYF